jgi:hypothetical protein
MRTKKGRNPSAPVKPTSQRIISLFGEEPGFAGIDSWYKKYM